jgi:hypothetical protein
VRCLGDGAASLDVKSSATQRKMLFHFQIVLLSHKPTAATVTLALPLFKRHPRHSDTAVPSLGDDPSLQCTSPRCPLPFWTVATWVGAEASFVKYWEMLACIRCTCSLYAFSVRVWLLHDNYSYMYVLVQVAPCPIHSFNNRSDHAT